MDLIYQNFDGLDVTFQGAVPEHILRCLEQARLEAEQTPRGNTPTKIELGKNKVPVHVASTGMKGGFRYRFDTGLDGEIWCISNSNDPTQWNIRVSVKSLSLALYGYRGVKERIYAMLENLDAKGSGEINPLTGEIYTRPREAISRVDYCFDFKSDNFQINPELLIAHSRCKKRYIYPQEVISTGRHISYLRVGEMPNRQVVVYDKIREIQAMNKIFWWKIWDLNKDDFKQKIWRIEVRAGKKELKSWNLRTFDDFEQKIGDVILSILKEIKYVSSNYNDSNKARWPLSPFWRTAQKSAKNALAEYISNAKRNPVIEEYKNVLINRYKNQFFGMMPAYAAITGETDAAHIPGVLEALLGDISEEAQRNKIKIQKKIDKAKDKYVFLETKDVT